MQLEEVSIKIPREVRFQLHESLEEAGKDIKIQAAVQYYRKRKLSLGKAADLAAMTRIEFIDYLRFNNEPIFDYNDEEMAEIHSDAEQLGRILE